MMLQDRWLVKILLSFGWARSRQKELDSIRKFSAIEDDSAWQIRYVAERTEDPKIRARLFFQHLEEHSHSQAFARIWEQRCGKRFRPLRYPRKALYPNPKQFPLFFIYCWIGEKSAAKRFFNISQEWKEPSLNSTLRQIVTDESGHVANAKQIAQQFGLNAGQLQRIKFKIETQRFLEVWLRLGEAIADQVGNIFLGILYYPVGFLFARRAKEKLIGTRR